MLGLLKSAIFWFIILPSFRGNESPQVPVTFRCFRKGTFEVSWIPRGGGQGKVVARLSDEHAHTEGTSVGDIFEFRRVKDGRAFGRTQVRSSGTVTLTKAGTLLEEYLIEEEDEFDTAAKRHLQKYAYLYKRDVFRKKAQEWEARCKAEFASCAPRFCDPFFPENVHAIGQIMIPRTNWESEMRVFQPNRHALIASQPSKLPRFTAEGYKLMDWPEDQRDLLGEILKAVELNRNEARPGGYDMFNPYVSAWESNIWVYSIGARLVKRMEAMLKSLLEKWSGEQLTFSMYHGPRIYRKNSVLNMHVDVFKTHVISAIVHLGHKDVNEHWPLEIIGLDGNAKNVSTDTPGQIVLYESAKLLHGRPTPFNGTEYINIFYHFRPVGWQDPQQWIHSVRKTKPVGWQEHWDPQEL